jgi:hypothetical protein
MGNAFGCVQRKQQRGAALASRSKRMGSARAPRGGAAKLTPAEEELLHRQALAMAIHQHLDAGGSMSRRIDAGGASMSRRIGPGNTSSRRHGSLPDSVTNAKAVRLPPLFQLRSYMFPCCSLALFSCLANVYNLIINKFLMCVLSWLNFVLPLSQRKL